MLKDALFIAGNDLRIMIKQKEAILWVFIMPFVFFYFIGAVTGGSGMSPSGPVSLAVQVGDNGGYLADELLRRLEEQDMKPVLEFKDDLSFDDYTRRLIIPADFTQNLLADEPQEVTFRRRGEGLTSDYDQFRVYRAVNTVLADLAAANLLAEEMVTIKDFEKLHAMPRNLEVEVSTAGNLEKVPRGFDQSVPGIMVMFTLLVLLTTGAGNLLNERREGLLRRLASAPISRASVVTGKWLGKLALGLIQIIFAMIVGSLLFGVSWGPQLAMVALVLAGYAILVSWLGMLLGCLARTEGQAVAAGVLAANVFAALGGCWWPIEVTSPFMQKLALFLPTGWAMDALHKLVFFGDGAVSALPHLLGMLLASLLTAMWTVRVFRFD
ncbi:MAG: ABC transporter permease [Acidobacteriota bacterium]|nr:ABC transporter permease [Acidobacteriota bacterium]